MVAARFLDQRSVDRASSGIKDVLMRLFGIVKIIVAAWLIISHQPTNAQTFKSLKYTGFVAQNGPAPNVPLANPSTVFSGEDINSYVLSYDNQINIEYYGNIGVGAIVANLFEEKYFNKKSCSANPNVKLEIQSWMSSNFNYLKYVKSFYVDEPYLKFENCDFAITNSALEQFSKIVKEKWSSLKPRGNDPVEFGISEPYGGHSRFAAPITSQIDWIGLQCYPNPLSHVPSATACKEDFQIWRSHSNVTVKKFVLMPPVFDYTSVDSAKHQLVSEAVQLASLRAAFDVARVHQEVIGVMPFGLGVYGVYNQDGTCRIDGDWVESRKEPTIITEPPTLGSPILWGCTTFKKYPRVREYVLSEFRQWRMLNNLTIQSMMVD